MIKNPSLCQGKIVTSRGSFYKLKTGNPGFVSRLEHPNLSSDGGIGHEETTMGEKRWRRNHESHVVPKTHLETEAETKVDQIPEPQT